MKAVIHILRQIEYRWLNAHWLIVLAALFACDWEITMGAKLPGILLTIALSYFVLWTWPRRWVLDVMIVWLFIEMIVDLFLAPPGLRRWLWH
jgi:hypothetical protein